MQPRLAPPEHPFEEYPQPHPVLRFLTNIRDHRFALALVVIALGAIAALHQFRQWEAAHEEASPLWQGSGNVALLREGAAALTVDTYPDGAEMFVDGAALGRTPLQHVTLPPGTYHLSIRKDAYAVVDSTVTLAAGESALLFVPLDALPAVETEGSLPLAADSDEAPRDRRRRSERSQQATPPPAAPQKVAPAEVRSPLYARLEVRTDPPGAAVTMDDRFIGYTPLSLDNVTPGEHVLSFRKLGYETPTTVLWAVAGRSETIAPRLIPLAGTLKVLVKPWGTIYIDGELKQDASDVRYATTLPPGRYRVTVVHPVLGRWETMADIQPGQEASFVVDFNKTSR